ncbi:dienelactone hydrolase family protein [Colwellia sp. UCD-KL20]|uniref:dienelactone hydrolase family protein n=1 Tax=Colwellia sp. UCD-KL20 TaxID=1917165 RepID=UPI0009709E3B|nr:dienelactone hydrolase family protein [Colwellia sp. UCD-KL20]
MKYTYVVSDIFGLTPALKALVTTLNTALPVSAPQIIIVDPYHGEQMNFESEAAAYSYFTEHVGVADYAKHLRATLDLQIYSHNTVIGFSVGASALWALSAKNNINVDHAIYFYGSQIRHWLDIQPQIKSTVILPKKEEHFDVDDLQEKLKNLSMVSIKRCSFYHGFMNRHSVNFNEKAYRTYTCWLCEQLT